MRKILVMEDEDNIRAFVVLNLKRVGYDVVDVASGEAALEAFAQAGGDFDIAILDIMLPGIDGFEVCRRIREQSSSIGIIMLSAKSQEMDKVQGLMLGADDYITKPFSRPNCWPGWMPSIAGYPCPAAARLPMKSIPARLSSISPAVPSPRAATSST